MKNKKNLTGFIFNCLVGVGLVLIAGFNSPMALCAGAAVVNLAGVAMAQNKHSLYVGLAKEVWVPLVKEDFYPNSSFLTSAFDMSALVDNDKINFAEAGADPNVLKNNTTFPIAEAVATDSPKDITLDTYDTDSTIVRNAIAIELVYDQRVLYVNKHKKALRKRIGQDAAWAYAPTQNSTGNKNPVLNLAGGDSFIDAIIDLQAKYNEFDDDGTNRNLVLCPAHQAKIAKEDKVLYKAIMAEPGSMLYGFKIYAYSQNPIYTTAGVKATQGTAFVSGTHKLASFAFIGDEVMSAMGTVDMFDRLRDPDVKGDKFNFQMRALVSPLRDRYRGAILQ